MRTLKPSFFSNDQLAEVHPLGRLLFQGLWCMADREGRLEDRPKRIKAEVLPYDACNIERLLDDLQARGFILRYEVDGDRFIQVVNFAKHQNPHVKEPPSTIPAPDEHGASPVLPPNGHHDGPSSHARVLSHGLQEQEQEQEQSYSSSAASAAEEEKPSLEPVFSADEREVVDLVAGILVPIGLSAQPRFWRKVLDTYQALDLEAEAMAMADWLRRHRKRVCSTAFVLNWLKSSAERRSQKVVALNGRHADREAMAAKFAHLVPA